MIFATCFLTWLLLKIRVVFISNFKNLIFEFWKLESFQIYPTLIKKLWGKFELKILKKFESKIQKKNPLNKSEGYEKKDLKKIEISVPKHSISFQIKFFSSSFSQSKNAKYQIKNPFSTYPKILFFVLFPCHH